MYDEKNTERPDYETDRDEQTQTDLRRTARRLRNQRKKQSHPSHSVFWGLAFIAAAVLIILMQQHWINSGNLWKYIIIGIGSIFIIQAATTVFNTKTRPASFGRLVPGFILLFVGLGFLLNSSLVWPLALVAAGVAILFSSWFLEREIQKRKTTQENLHESELKYRHIIENANSVIMEINTEGNVTFINKFALDFFGFGEQEIVGHNLSGTILPTVDAGGEDQQKLIDDIVTSPGKYLHYEKENLRKNGDKVWITWTYKPIFDEENDLKEILCIGIDSTQQKKADSLATQQLKEKAAEEERTRLARDLHDAVSQTLFSTSLIAEVLPRLWERNKDEGLQKLEEVRQLTRGALAEMRTLLFELRPTALADAELSDLLRQLSESVIGRARVPITLEIEGNCAIPTDVKIALYRIAQEALNNIAKHSEASRAQITLHCQPHQVSLDIIDNGHGFDVTKVAPGSFGLGNMRERANHIGALLKIESKAGEGTEITVDWHDNGGEV